MDTSKNYNNTFKRKVVAEVLSGSITKEQYNLNLEKKSRAKQFKNSKKSDQK